MHLGDNRTHRALEILETLDVVDGRAVEWSCDIRLEELHGKCCELGGSPELHDSLRAQYAPMAHLESAAACPSSYHQAPNLHLIAKALAVAV